MVIRERWGDDHETASFTERDTGRRRELVESGFFGPWDRISERRAFSQTTSHVLDRLAFVVSDGGGDD